MKTQERCEAETKYERTWQNSKFQNLEDWVDIYRRKRKKSEVKGMLIYMNKWFSLLGLVY